MKDELSEFARLFIAVAGYPISESRVYVLAQLQSAFEKKIPSAQIMVRDLDGDWINAGRYRWSGVDLTGLEEAGRDLIVLGRDGEVATWGSAGAAVESDVAGKKTAGPFRGLRVIGGRVFAYGMRRQVYRRESENEWTPWMRGFPTISRDALRDHEARMAMIRRGIGGITAIAGASSEEMYAVGLDGEIWRNDGGQWRSLDSPTNANLYDATIGMDNDIYICGQSGTLLRGRGDTWRQVEFDGAGDLDFYSIAYFGETLYLADGQSLMTLKDGVMSIVDMGVEGIVPSHQVSAVDGTLLSVAGKEIFLSVDGETWTSVT